MTNIHIMVDLETWSTTPEALIWAIGACKFDPDKGKIVDSFYTVLDPSTQTQFKRHIDPNTVTWWMNKDRREPLDQLVDANPVDFVSGLEGFNMWFGSESLPVWGNGATFDNVILRNAIESIGYDAPWKFRHDRCHRTMKSMLDIPEMKREGTYHNALDDAITQAQHLMEIAKAKQLVLA